MRIDRLHHVVLRELRRLMGATDGVVALIVALSILPVVTLAGAAVDLRRVSAARTNLQATADAAALAGADALRRGGNVAAARAAATAFVNAAIVEGASMRPTLASLPDVGATSVNVKLNMSVPMTLMKIARINTVSVKAEAMADYQSTETDKPIEVALALDTTGSMGLEGRLGALKRAANTLVDKVTTLPDGSRDPNVRIGVVPFDNYVNVGLRYRSASWLYGGEDRPSSRQCYTPAAGAPFRYKECLTWHTATQAAAPQTCLDAYERPYDCTGPAQNFTVCDSYGDQWLIYDPPPPTEVCNTTDAAIWHGCVGSMGDPVDTLLATQDNLVPAIMNRECAGPLLRLTADLSSVRAAIDGLTAQGETYIAPGLLWAYRLISTDAPFRDGRSLATTRKAIVLMTDGANTRAASYPEHESDNVLSANYKLGKVCFLVKEAGIPIYAIGFKLPNDDIRSLLIGCVTDPSYYYDADDNQALLAAFERIAGRVRQEAGPLRLVR